VEVGHRILLIFISCFGAYFSISRFGETSLGFDTLPSVTSRQMSAESVPSIRAGFLEDLQAAAMNTTVLRDHKHSVFAWFPATRNDVLNSLGSIVSREDDSALHSSTMCACRSTSGPKTANLRKELGHGWHALSKVPLSHVRVTIIVTEVLVQSSHKG